MYRHLASKNFLGTLGNSRRFVVVIWSVFSLIPSLRYRKFVSRQLRRTPSHQHPEFRTLYTLPELTHLLSFVCRALAGVAAAALTLAKSEISGLVWGEAHKLVPVAFGVKKLVLSCVVEDDKVRGGLMLIGWGGRGGLSVCLILPSKGPRRLCSAIV